MLYISYLMKCTCMYVVTRQDVRTLMKTLQYPSVHWFNVESHRFMNSTSPFLSFASPSPILR